MGITLKPEYMKRYMDIARLIVKYGGENVVLPLDIESADLSSEAAQSAEDGANSNGGGAASGGAASEGAAGKGPAGESPAQQDKNGAANPEALAKDLEVLGPTYIKIGQFLSTRPDLISPRFIPALSRLQDHVDPMPFDQVEAIVTEELGIKISKAFLEFNPVPVAAASLSQVHRARLREGKEVAVKVQRPGIRQTIFQDLDAFADIAEIIQKHTQIGSRFAIQDMLASFRTSLIQELDFRREANNLRRLADILRDYTEIVVPLPVDDYTTSRLLTMDFIEGANVGALNPVVLLDYDRPRLAEALGKAYLDQILVHGFIHADPHPGNVLLTADGRLALVDLGMVTYTTPTRQEQLLKLLLATSEGRADEVARIMMQIGTPLEERNEARFTEQVGSIVMLNRDATLEDIRFGRVVAEMIRIAAENGIRPAPELSMMGKALLNLDETSRLIDPTFNPNTLVRSYIQNLTSRRILQNLSPANVLSSGLELYDFIQKLPGRLNLILEKLTSEQLEIRVHAFDETAFLTNMQKIANRITVGVVLAALIIGAALMMQVRTAFTILGYPGIAVVMFFLAAILGFLIVGRIIVEDFRGH